MRDAVPFELLCWFPQSVKASRAPSPASAAPVWDLNQISQVGSGAGSLGGVMLLF